MAIITDRSRVKEIYRQAYERKWVIPCFCSENLTTSEAVLSAAQEFAVHHGLARVPVTLAITVQYDHRFQSRYYTHTRRWDTGLRLFRADADILADPDGPFPNVDVLLHLDHVQYDSDAELLTRDLPELTSFLSDFSSIMYDASTLPLEENIKRTAEFVERTSGTIMTEGACDEIFDAVGDIRNALTTPEKAKKYYTETGVDWIVANLGTEHRASGQVLHYYNDVAQEIKRQIGSCIVLHGLSSVSPDQVTNLFHDGICKVNIWTMLERDSSPVLLREMIQNAVKVGGTDMVNSLIREDFLSKKSRTNEKAAISHFTTVWRQDIIFTEMKKIVRKFLDMFYIMK